MPKKLKIFSITLVLFLGYLILLLLIGVEFIFAMIAKGLAFGNQKYGESLSKLKWARSNLRISRHEPR